jgi:hypothetical protein
MKRLVAVVSLIICLSFPVLGGHTQSGDSYCDCGTAGCVESYPGECGSNYQPVRTRQNESPRDVNAELGILIVAVLLWLRLRA